MWNEYENTNGPETYTANILGFGQETYLQNTEYPYLRELGVEEIDIHPANYLMTFLAVKICTQLKKEGNEAFVVTLGGIAKPNAEFARNLIDFLGLDVRVFSDASSFSTATNIESLNRTNPQIPDGIPIIIFQSFARDRTEMLLNRTLKKDFIIQPYEEYFNRLRNESLLEKEFSVQELGILEELEDLLERFPVKKLIKMREPVLKFFDEYFPWLIKSLAVVRRKISGIPFEKDLES